MRDRLLDRAVPFETEIAVAGLHRQPRHLRRMDAGPMHVELAVAEAVGKAHRAGDQLGTHNLDVKFVRARPVRDMDDAVIQAGLRHRKVLLPQSRSYDPRGMDRRGPGSYHA